MAKLIVCEGIDGSGKTTIAKQLKNLLGDEACFVSKKSLDASTEFQRQFMSEIKLVLWDRKPNESIFEIDETTWLYLHMLWYHMLQEYVIMPKLKRYKYVIMDGWFYKFLARHYVNNNKDCTTAEYLTRRLLEPDIIFLLNASPELCYNRKEKIMASECGVHNERVSIELTASNFCEYQKEVFAAYLEILKNSNVTIIDAEQEIDSIIRTIILEVDKNDFNKS